MSYVPDNLDAYYAHQAEQDRRAEMAEYSLPKCPVCEEPGYLMNSFVAGGKNGR